MKGNKMAKTWLSIIAAVIAVILVSFRRRKHLVSQVEVPSAKQQGELKDENHKLTPYEQRWPGFELPYYAHKSIVPLVEVPKDKETCFVHVGKTAGSTVGCSLGFQLHCEITEKTREKYLFFHETYYESATPVLPGLLPQYATHTFHREIDDCTDDPAFYLFVLRNPLERAKSAYAYDRIREKSDDIYGKGLLYLECPFDTLNELAEKGLAEDGDASELCKQRAYDDIRGNERYGSHLFYNYHFYASAVLKEDNLHNVLVIRTEHLSGDWNSVEQFLGGEGETADFPVRNAGTHKTDEDKHLSEEARVLICAALCDDIQSYKDILRRAVNLDAAQIDESMEDLRKSCPVEADIEFCPAN